MTPAELRAITAQGPAVVMSSREDFLRLLDERDGWRALALWMLWSAAYAP
jgi:hypothetical protein